MKVKGRRQSGNVVDIRDPVAKAKRDVRMQNDPQMPATRIEEEVANRQGAAKIQAMIRDPVKEHFRRRKEEGVWLEADEIMNAGRAGRVQDTFGRQAVEMLLGPRWKD